MLLQGRDVLEGRSYRNALEAQCAVELVLQGATSGTLTPEEVAIITPYAAQISLISSLVRRDARLSAVAVRSISACQGQEHGWIVAPCVRSNSCGQLGLLADPERVNSILTRGRRGLVVLGSVAAL